MRLRERRLRKDDSEKETVPKKKLRNGDRSKKETPKKDLKKRLQKRYSGKKGLKNRL